MSAPAAAAAAAPAPAAAPVRAASPAVKKQKKASVSTFKIIATRMVEDKLLVAEQFEKYIAESLKVKSMGGVKGKVGDAVKVSRDGGVITVTVQNESAPKRQLKYLTRRYLKKQGLSNYVRVYAPKKDAYEIKYLASANAEEEEEEEGEDVE